MLYNCLISSNCPKRAIPLLSAPNETQTISQSRLKYSPGSFLTPESNTKESFTEKEKFCFQSDNQNKCDRGCNKLHKSCSYSKINVNFYLIKFNKIKLSGMVMRPKVGK